MKKNKEVSAYINNAPHQQKELLEILRHLIHKTVSETTEELKWGIPVFTKTRIFTYLRSAKNHVTIGFYNIDRINDPNGQLEGSGKNMQHLKIKKVEDVDEELINKWLKVTVE